MLIRHVHLVLYSFVHTSKVNCVKTVRNWSVMPNWAPKLPKVEIYAKTLFPLKLFEFLATGWITILSFLSFHVISKRAMTAWVVQA